MCVHLLILITLSFINGPSLLPNILTFEVFFMVSSSQKVTHFIFYNSGYICISFYSNFYMKEETHSI